jgi:hypothetical protein
MPLCWVAAVSLTPPKRIHSPSGPLACVVRCCDWTVPFTTRSSCCSMSSTTSAPLTRGVTRKPLLRLRYSVTAPANGRCPPRAAAAVTIGTSLPVLIIAELPSMTCTLATPSLRSRAFELVAFTDTAAPRLLTAALACARSRSISC